MFLSHRGEISIRRASLEFNIPKSTLNDKLTGKTPVDAGRVGPPSMLTTDEEEALVKYIKSSSRRALPVTRASVLNDVSEILQKELDRGVQRRLPPHMTGVKPSGRWWNLFKRRHPNLPYNTSNALSLARKNVSRASVEQWFWYTQRYFIEIGQLPVLSDPSRMFNMDEVISNGQCNTTMMAEDKTNLTVLSMVCADGRLPPPCIVYPGVKVEYMVIAALPPSDELDCNIGHSTNGHLTKEVLYEYLCGSFHKWLERHNVQRPVVVWTDWHETRINYHLATKLEDLGIILFGLPLKTSQVLKPVEVTIRRPLREAWKLTIDRWHRDYPERRFGVVDFAPVFLPTYYNAVSPQNIVRGFRVCGLCPFDYSIPDYSKLETCKTQKKNDNLAPHNVRCMSGKSYQIM